MEVSNWVATSVNGKTEGADHACRENADRHNLRLKSRKEEASFCKFLYATFSGKIYNIFFYIKSNFHALLLKVIIVIQFLLEIFLKKVSFYTNASVLFVCNYHVYDFIGRTLNISVFIRRNFLASVFIGNILKLHFTMERISMLQFFIGRNFHLSFFIRNILKIKFHTGKLSLEMLSLEKLSSGKLSLEKLS